MLSIRLTLNKKLLTDKLNNQVSKMEVNDNYH